MPSILAFHDLRRRLAAATPELSDRKRLATLLALDPPAVYRALRLVTARMHGEQQEAPDSVESLAMSLGRVGLQRLFDVPELEADRRLRARWRLSIGIACAARRLARLTGVESPERAYLRGLMLDLDTWSSGRSGVDAVLRRILDLPEEGPRHCADFENTAEAPELLLRDHPEHLLCLAVEIAELAGLAPTDEDDFERRLTQTSREALVLAHETRLDLDSALAEFGLGADDGQSEELEGGPQSLFGRPQRPAQSEMVLALLQCKRASTYQEITTLSTNAAVRFLDFDRAFYVTWNPGVQRCFARCKTDMTRVPLVRAPIEPLATECSAIEAALADSSPRLIEDSDDDLGLCAWLGTEQALVAPIDRGNRSASLLVLDRATSGRPIDLVEDGRDVAALAGFVTLLTDNLRLRLERLRARRDATIDPLTRLANRGHGMLVLEQQVAKARRSALPLCVLMVDLDEFKLLNDRLGHLAGDQALQLSAQVLRRNVRDADTVCRFGGEEFVIVLPDTGPQEAALLAARLFTAIEAQGIAEELPVTASIGLATLRHGEDDVASLLERADRALYASKEHGRNRFSADIE